MYGELEGVTLRVRCAERCTWVALRGYFGGGFSLERLDGAL